MKIKKQLQWSKVTVVIVNWNGSSFLDRCLSALMAQTVAPHEIVLVDNASTDASLDIVRRFPMVRLLVQDENHGFARGNNIAISAADTDSEWIALLNPDAFPETQWLETLLFATIAYPAFDIFASKLVNANDDTVLDSAGDAYHISGLPWRIGYGKKIGFSLSAQTREVFSPCAAAAMYRRSALCDVGGFDEDYFCYVEDVDLGFRLRLAGYRCLYVPSSVAHHVGSGTTGGQLSEFVLYYGNRNLVWTFVKGMPGILFWVFLPLHVLLNLVTIFSLTLKGRRAVIMRAKRDALLGLPKMWRKRRDIQKNRKVPMGEIWHVNQRAILSRLGV